MAMLGSKSILDMTDEEYQSWRKSAGRQIKIENRFREMTDEVVASAKLHKIFFGMEAQMDGTLPDPPK